MSYSIIDFHAHILPRADHGSSSLEVSKEQLLLAASHGVTHIVATPHFYPDKHTVDDFLKKREASYAELSTILSSSVPRVYKGAEVLICDGIERLPGIERLCVEGTNILLLELPFSVFKSGYRNSVLRLIKQGLKVVLAHVDRYDPESIEMLSEIGALMQLNAESLSSLLVPSHVKKWLSLGDVVALGSDIHGVDAGAYNRFDKAMKRIFKLKSEASLLSFSDELISKLN